MITSRYPRKRLLLYLVPILMGLVGIQFSMLLDNTVLQGIMLMVSVAIPLISCGNLLARFQISLVERVVLLLGVLLLLAGAGLSVSGIGGNVADGQYMGEDMVMYFRMIGIGSLMLGLIVVLYMVGRTGEDIEEMAERFSYLTNHMHEGFILSRVNGPVLMVNKRFLEMFGVREQEVLGQSPNEFAERFNLQGAPDNFEGRTDRGVAEYEVVWNVDGEERHFWMSSTSVLNRAGRHYANLATVREITEQRRLAQRVERYAASLQTLVEEQTKKLKQSEDRFRTLLLSMNEGFLTVDGSNRIQFANKRICDLLGLPESALIDQDILDFTDRAGRVRLLNILVKRGTLLEEEARLELNFVRAGGDLVPAMLAVTYLPHGNNNEPAHSLVVTDVSELKTMQHQLEERARELEELNEELLMHDRAKDSFLSNVSHELRTPLSTIQGYVEMLNSGSLGELGPDQHSAVRVMERNVRRLIGHLNEIIEFSRMEIRGVQIARRLISPGNLIQETISSFHPAALARDIQLTMEGSEDIPPTWCDREKMDQVLGILVNNALKFTPEGGKITIRAETAPDHGVRIRVSDTGIGIKKEHHQKIFDKFFQVDSSKTRRYEGTGIGLSIAKSIVEAHGGSISVQSEEGHGCTFTIEMPGAIFNDSWTRETLNGLPNLDVLVVDEGEAFPRALATVLDPLGVSCRRASNGYQCVREVESQRPDLILLNDTAKDIAGMNTLTLLRQSLFADNVPVIAFSGESSERLREAGALWGDISFISKPFTAQDLVEALYRICIAGTAETGFKQGAAIPAARPMLARILVVDSDPGLLDWVETAMSRRQVLAYCATSLEQAREVLQSESPDVIFVDVDVPGASVSDVLEKIVKDAREPGVPVYIMTGLPQRIQVPKGAVGYLRKPFTSDEVLARVAAHVSLDEISAMT